MSPACAYCDSEVDRHQPVFVRDGASSEPDPFCNYACLVAHIEANELTYGAACEWNP
ncbi:hypothetical protein [Halovivax limisalsi]|uniref:hypothetical protein n=1 Tax=Halovivax limisalsi TaxID=1453760 RepID=UPI001FFC34C1|nr:hypothetical protein [Halovivax limisalsi]